MTHCRPRITLYSLLRVSNSKAYSNEQKLIHLSRLIDLSKQIRTQKNTNPTHQLLSIQKEKKSPLKKKKIISINSATNISRWNEYFDEGLQQYSFSKYMTGGIYEG